MDLSKKEEMSGRPVGEIKVETYAASGVGEL